jgi:hypothetical protein
MNISSFDDLLRAAQQQPEPQRLLFVFANGSAARRQYARTARPL